MVSLRGSITKVSLISLYNMQFILKCPNGKRIDMSTYVLKQLTGEITQSEVNERIEFYKSKNTI